jgi:hypothetical protein
MAETDGHDKAALPETVELKLNCQHFYWEPPVTQHAGCAGNARHSLRGLSFCTEKKQMFLITWVFICSFSGRVSQFLSTYVLLSYVYGNFRKYSVLYNKYRCTGTKIDGRRLMPDNS